MPVGKPKGINSGKLVIKRASGLAKADLQLGRERLGVGHVRIRLRRAAAAPHNNVERGERGYPFLRSKLYSRIAAPSGHVRQR
jgi:hypothetical protein